MRSKRYVLKVEGAYALLAIPMRDGKRYFHTTYAYTCGSHRGEGWAWRETDLPELELYNIFVKRGREFFKDKDFDEQVQLDARERMLDALVPVMFMPPMEEYEEKEN